MVGFTREETVAPLGNVDTCAAILPRRILFHLPLKVPLLASPSLALTPLNFTPPRSSSSSADLEDPVHHESSHDTVPLPTILIRKIGVGLNNLGNTCFLNAVLQCLTYTPPLAAYFQAGRHQSSCRSVGFCAMCALESHVKQALSSRGRVISPNLLVKNLRCISRSFQIGRQEDAHEYMRYLIEALQKSCSLEACTNTASSSHRNFIQRIFGGRLQSQVKCTQCLQSSNTYDPFLDLSLDIVKADSLLKALARFTAIEILDGDNKYHCCQCKAKVRAHKQFTIDNAPQVLTVQFKRFSSSGGYGGKIDKRVQFDRSFNLRPFVNGGKEGCLRYSLYAVLVHSGWSTHSGHYYCFVRTTTGMWHKLDDNQVSQVSEKIVLEQKAYILFYVQDTEALQSSNGNDHGIRFDRVFELNGSSDVVKRYANGTSCHKDATRLMETLYTGSNNDNHVARILSNNVNNNISNNIQGVPSMATLGNMVKAPASSATKACNPAPSRVIGKDRSVKVDASGGCSLCNKYMGNNDDDILNNGVQMNGDRNGPPTKNQAKSCTFAPAETKSHLTNGTQIFKNSFLTEKNMRMDDTLHHENHDGSMKRICLTNVKEADAKVDMLQRLERQAAYLEDSTNNVLSRKEGEVSNKKIVGQSMSCSALPLSNNFSFEMSVPCWEENAEESKRNTSEEQKLMAEPVVHCGYVLDKWDEEYDQGKRKKPRRREEVMQDIANVSVCFPTRKKRKKSLEEPVRIAAPTRNDGFHGNAFQVLAGKKVQPGVGTPRLKKSRKQHRALGHRLFLKRHRFRKLHTNCKHRRKH